MWPSFCKSSQTISVGRCGGGAGRGAAGRCRRPRSSRRCAARSSCPATPACARRPPGNRLASRWFSTSSALMFSRWAQAWCLVSETIQMYGSQPSTAARSGKASVPMVDLAPPRGPSTLSFVPRADAAGVELPGQPAVHLRRRPAKVVRQIFLAPGQQVEAVVGRGGPAAVPGRAGGPIRRATSPAHGQAARAPIGHRPGGATAIHGDSSAVASPAFASRCRRPARPPTVDRDSRAIRV